LQDKDIEQTRSRPYQKNDQAHVESKNNHAVVRHEVARNELIGRLEDRLMLAA
jgi:hypothetical protein